MGAARYIGPLGAADVEGADGSPSRGWSGGCVRGRLIRAEAQGLALPPAAAERALDVPLLMTSDLFAGGLGRRTKATSADSGEAVEPASS
jgi:hypothetical protein